MRIPITIPDDLLTQVQKVSGKKSPSDAIVAAIEHYIALREQLAVLEDRFRREAHASDRAKRKSKL